MRAANCEKSKWVFINGSLAADVATLVDATPTSRPSTAASAWSLDYFLTLAGVMAAGAEQSSFVVVATTVPSGATDLELTWPTSVAEHHHLIGVGEHTSAKR